MAEWMDNIAHEIRHLVQHKEALEASQARFLSSQASGLYYKRSNKEPGLFYELDVFGRVPGRVDTLAAATMAENDASLALNTSSSIVLGLSSYASLFSAIGTSIDDFDSSVNDTRRRLTSSLASARIQSIKNHRDNLVALLFRRSICEQGEIVDTVVEHNKQAYSDQFSTQMENLSGLRDLMERLHLNMHTLEQNNVKMESLFLMNRDRLEYNLRVLQVRSSEHRAVHSAAKARLNKLHSVKAALTERLNQSNISYTKANHALGDALKRQAKQYGELREKFRQQSSFENLHYGRLWGMHLAEVEELHEKLCSFHCTVNTGILGLSGKVSFDNSDLDAAQSEAAITVNSSSRTPHDKTVACSKFSTSKVGKVLELLGRTSQYLTRDAENSRWDIQKIIYLIGVESIDEMDLLVSSFYEGQDDDDETVLVSVEDCLAHLANFIATKEAFRFTQVSPRSKKPGSLLAESNEAKDRRRKEESRFWDRLSDRKTEPFGDKYHATVLRKAFELLRVLRKRRVDQQTLHLFRRNRLRLASCIQSGRNSSAVNDLIVKPHAQSLA